MQKSHKKIVINRYSVRLFRLLSYYGFLFYVVIPRFSVSCGVLYAFKEGVSVYANNIIGKYY
jgi:hypothetical protein